MTTRSPLRSLAVLALAGTALASSIAVATAPAQQQRPAQGGHRDSLRGGAAQDTAERWGLEWALLKEGFNVHVRGADRSLGMTTAGELLKQYGPAYLLTSTSLAAVSYAGCYMAVNRGVNVVGLLARFGLKASA